MNIQQHQRIAQIKKVSGYLAVTLTWIGYLMWLLWPALLLPLLPNTTIKLMGSDACKAMSNLALGYPARIVIVLLSGIGLYFAQQFVRHLRDLMRHFSRGEIFNAGAITLAKRALSRAMILFWLNIGFLFASQIVRAMNSAWQSITIDPSVLIYGFLAFGLMYVLLWTLEIGHDLNEESELTV